MELGLGTIVYEFAGIPLSAAIPRIADFGLHYLDVLAFGIFNPALYTSKERLRLANLMNKYDMRASSIVTCGEGNLASDDKNETALVMTQLKKAAELVKDLGGKQVLIGKGVGNIDFDLPRERAEQNTVNLVKEYCDWCIAQDIVVTFELEPEALHVCNGIESMARLIAKVDAPNVAANMDIGHLNILRTRPDACQILKDKIIHVHLSDNAGLAHTNSVLGEGTADFNAYIKQYIDWGIDENAKRYGDIAVAGMEIGEPGEYITDPDNRILKSMGHILLHVPQLAKD